MTTLNFHILVAIRHGANDLSGEISIFVALVGGRHYFPVFQIRKGPDWQGGDGRSSLRRGTAWVVVVQF